MSSPVRPNVLRMRPYSPGKPIEEVRRELGLTHIIKLASNENPWGPSPAAAEAIKRATQEMHLYPDGAAYDLRMALSKHYGVPLDQIVAANGSDELIQMLGLVLLGDPEDEVLTCEPSFVRYASAAMLAPCQFRHVPLDSDQRYDLDALGDALTDRTKIVFIANPNNPTGTAVSKRDLEAFIRRLPESATLVIDEAYFEFAKVISDDYPSSQDYLDTGHVVGLRTFSKAYGLAGVRVGFGFFPSWLSDAMERIRPPFNVNSLAQAAGIAALGDDNHVKKTVEGTIRGLARITAVLEKVGARAIPSCANFVWADMGQPSRPIYEALLHKGVIVRPGDVLGNPSALRISVGTDEELDVFEKSMLEVMQGAAVH